MISELVEGESIGIGVKLFRIFLVGGEEVMALLEVLGSVILFEGADGAHLGNGFGLGVDVEGGPVGLEARLIDLEVALLAPAGFVVGAGGEVEEGGGVLPGDRLAGGLLYQILFFHLFYNFYRNGRTNFKTLSIPPQRLIPASFVPFYSIYYTLTTNQNLNFRSFPISESPIIAWIHLDPGQNTSNRKRSSDYGIVAI